MEGAAGRLWLSGRGEVDGSSARACRVELRVRNLKMNRSAQLSVNIYNGFLIIVSLPIGNGWICVAPTKQIYMCGVRLNPRFDLFFGGRR
jgi:hypothetical protein